MWSHWLCGCCNKISISMLVIKTPGEKINLAVVVTWCRLRGLTQTADIKGSWLVFKNEDGMKQQQYSFHLIINYSFMYVFIASFLLLNILCFGLHIIIVMSWSKIKSGWNKMWKSAILIYLYQQKDVFCLFLFVFCSKYSFIVDV